MPMTKKALLRRDATRDIGAELLESIRSLNLGEAGRIYVIQLRTGGRGKLVPNEPNPGRSGSGGPVPGMGM